MSYILSLLLFQQLLKDNKSRRCSMLGSFYAAFVDCHTPLDINVEVQGLLDGWDLVGLKPKVIYL
jgi:hypothetical protein